MLFLVILGVVIAIVAILFAFQNSAIVTINFGIWQFKESLAIILLVTLGLGIIISLLLSIPTIIKRGWQTSRQKKKIQALEAELQSRNTEIVGREQVNRTSEQKTFELLQAFTLSDSITGLLNQDSAVTLTDYLLQQIISLSSNPRYNSLSVFLLSIEPAKLNQYEELQGQENAIYRGITNRLKNTIDTEYFLGITNKRRFICICLGKTEPSAIEYCNFLIKKLTETPLQKADGSSINLKVSIGGIIADPSDNIDGKSIFKQAEQNLEKARQNKQKRNSIVVTEVAAVV